MKRTLYLTVIATLLLVLALGGWMVDGVRWALTGPSRVRTRPATA